MKNTDIIGVPETGFAGELPGAMIRIGAAINNRFSGNIGFGNEFYTAPQARSVTGGLRFSF